MFMPVVFSLTIICGNISDVESNLTAQLEKCKIDQFYLVDGSLLSLSLFHAITK